MMWTHGLCVQSKKTYYTYSDSLSLSLSLYIIILLMYKRNITLSCRLAFYINVVTLCAYLYYQSYEELTVFDFTYRPQAATYTKCESYCWFQWNIFTHTTSARGLCTAIQNVCYYRKCIVGEWTLYLYSRRVSSIETECCWSNLRIQNRHWKQSRQLFSTVYIRLNSISDCYNTCDDTPYWGLFVSHICRVAKFSLSS